MDLTELYSTYSKMREKQVSPTNMLKIILYGYMNGFYSSRDIERACLRDINFMFLLEGASSPDDSTFAFNYISTFIRVIFNAKINIY